MSVVLMSDNGGQVSGVPHPPQKRSPGSLGKAHWVQAYANRWPHAAQYCRPVLFCVRHCVQVMR
jgi:hypothetical protein